MDLSDIQKYKMESSVENTTQCPKNVQEFQLNFYKYFYLAIFNIYQTFVCCLKCFENIIPARKIFGNFVRDYWENRFSFRVLSPEKPIKYNTDFYFLVHN